MGALRILAISLLVLSLWPDRDGRDDDTTAIIGDQVMGTSATPTPITATEPDAVSAEAEIAGADDPVLTLARLWSPMANVARVDGVLTASGPTSLRVQVNNSTIGQITVEPDSEGRFTVDIPNLGPGPTTLCLADVCGQILILDPSIEMDERLDAYIREGIALALARFDINTHLPGWSIDPAGPDNAGVGYTLVDARAIFISATLEQTTEEIATTVLHEIGHAIDASELDDTERQIFRALRGHAAEVPWTQPVDHLSVDGRWLNGAEDFAEVFVAWANGGDYVTQTRVVSPQPSSSDLTEFCSLIESTTIGC